MKKKNLRKEKTITELKMYCVPSAERISKDVTYISIIGLVIEIVISNQPNHL